MKPIKSHTKYKVLCIQGIALRENGSETDI